MISFSFNIEVKLLSVLLGQLGKPHKTPRINIFKAACCLPLLCCHSFKEEWETPQYCKYLKVTNPWGSRREVSHESVDTCACVSLRAGEKNLEFIHLFCPDFPCSRLRHSLNEKDSPYLSIFLDTTSRTLACKLEAQYWSPERKKWGILMLHMVVYSWGPRTWEDEEGVVSSKLVR